MPPSLSSSRRRSWTTLVRPLAFRCSPLSSCDGGGRCCLRRLSTLLLASASLCGQLTHSVIPGQRVVRAARAQPELMPGMRPRSHGMCICELLINSRRLSAPPPRFEPRQRLPPPRASPQNPSPPPPPPQQRSSAREAVEVINPGRRQYWTKTAATPPHAASFSCVHPTRFSSSHPCASRVAPTCCVAAGGGGARNAVESHLLPRFATITFMFYSSYPRRGVRVPASLLDAL